MICSQADVRVGQCQNGVQPVPISNAEHTEVPCGLVCDPEGAQIQLDKQLRGRANSVGRGANCIGFCTDARGHPISRIRIRYIMEYLYL
jgi:hypothetical protein